jgi:hypothetical protein
MLLQTFLDSIENKTNLSIDKEFSKQACQTITFNGKVVGNYILEIDESENIVSGSLSTNKQYYVFNTPDDSGVSVDTLDDFTIKINQLFSTGECDDLVTISVDLDSETLELVTQAAEKAGVAVEEFVISVLESLVEQYQEQHGALK